MPRYRFAEFTVSPRRRTLLHGGSELPLIPRYFDLLVFLIERRHEAVHRRDIFDRVWADVIVSDSALSQAIRTLRRTLGDDSREPRFIRTVSRHGYQFVCPDVVEENDDGTVANTLNERPTVAAEPLPSGQDLGVPRAADHDVTTPDEVADDPDRFEPLLVRLTSPATSELDEEEQRDAAEILHGFGTDEALRRLGMRPGHAMARALLRDTRWNAPAAGPVPFIGSPGAAGAALALIRLRVRRAARIVAARWAAASIGGGVAGIIGGVLGGLLVIAAPGSQAPVTLAAVLGLLGMACGATAGAGVGAGLAAAEATARSWRRLTLAIAGAIGGGAAGLLAQWFGRLTLAALVGIDLRIGGGLDGIAIGGAAGLAYAATSGSSDGGFAAPRGAHRLRTVLLIGAATGVAAFLLTAGAGRPLVGGTIHMIATASRGAQAMLTPLGRLVGEPDFGPLSRTIIGTGEGVLFGLGLAIGLTRRPRMSGSTTSHQTLTNR